MSTKNYRWAVYSGDFLASVHVHEDGARREANMLGNCSVQLITIRPATAAEIEERREAEKLAKAMEKGGEE